jgi:hypothetical protein
MIIITAHGTAAYTKKRPWPYARCNCFSMLDLGGVSFNLAQKDDCWKETIIRRAAEPETKRRPVQSCDDRRRWWQSWYPFFGPVHIRPCELGQVAKWNRERPKHVSLPLCGPRERPVGAICCGKGKRELCLVIQTLNRFRYCTTVTHLDT